MAFLKRFFLIVAALSVVSCDILFGSYFPSGTDLVSATVDYTSFLGDISFNGTTVKMEEVDNHVGTSYLVIYVSSTDSSRVVALHTGDLSLVNSYTQERYDTDTVQAGMGKTFNRAIGWNFGNIYIGSASFNYSGFTGITSPVSGIMESLVNTFNGSNLLSAYAGGMSIYHANLYYQTGSSFTFATPGTVSSVEILDAYADTVSAYLAIRVSGPNLSEIWCLGMPVSAFGSSTVAFDTFKLFSVSTSDDTSSTFLTADGLILKESGDGNDRLVHYDYSGNMVDSIQFKNNNGWIQFAQDGKHWYRMDPYTKKLYRMRTWWSP